MLTSSSTNRRGMTVKGVLALLLIAGVLVVLFNPVCGCGREKARQISCASNEKHIGLALIQYAQDHDDQLPAGTQRAASTLGQGWAGQLYPYLKNTGVYRCPDDDDKANTVSYGYNSNIAQDTAGDLSGKSRQSLFSRPAKTVMAFEVSRDEADVTRRGQGSQDIFGGGRRDGRRPALHHG